MEPFETRHRLHQWVRHSLLNLVVTIFKVRSFSKFKDVMYQKTLKISKFQIPMYAILICDENLMISSTLIVQQNIYSLNLKCGEINDHKSKYVLFTRLFYSFSPQRVLLAANGTKIRANYVIQINTGQFSQLCAYFDVSF